MAQNIDKELDALLMGIRSTPNPVTGGYKTKEEWIAAVNKYKTEHGTTRGFQKGKLEYIDGDNKAWSYAAGSHGGPGHARSASSTDAYTERRGSMEVDQTLGAKTQKEATAQFNQASRDAGVQKGVHQMHHMRTLNQYEPLLAGLNEADTIEALEWFENEGFPLGNNKGNLLKQYMNQSAGGTTIADTHQGTGSIHKWMRHNRLEPTTKQAEYKRLAKLFEGKSLNERLPMYVTYLENIQGAVQEQLGQATSYTELNKLKAKVGTIPSGPRAGQPLPVNRRTLGDAIIKELQVPKKNPVTKGLGKALKIPLAGGLLAGGATLLSGGGAQAAVGEFIEAENPLSGGELADGTVTGFQQERNNNPIHYGKNGPNVPRPGQRERAQQLKVNPSSERGYETIGRYVKDSFNFMKQLMSSQ
jgi:hypothetical protein